MGEGGGQELADKVESTDSDIGMDEWAVELKHIKNVSRARKKYRVMRTYSMPYWYYYKCQIAKDQKMIDMKRQQYEEVCLNGKRVGSDFNRKQDMKKEAIIKELFKEYMETKKRLDEVREIMSVRKLQQTRAELALNRAKTAAKKGVFGRFKTVDEALAWIPKYQERLNVASGLKNKIISRASELRREVSSMLSERIMYTESVQKSLVHLTKGNKYMLDVLEQALMAFQTRESALVNLQKAMAKRKAIREEARKSLSYLGIRLERELEKARFFTQKGQQRIMQGLTSQDNFSPAAMAAKEKELREQVEDGFKYFLTVSGFFYTTNLNAQEIADTYRECMDMNFHILSFLIAEGVQSETSHYKANMYKNKVVMGKKHFIKEMDIQNVKISQLEDLSKYWETQYIQIQNEIEYAKKLKTQYLDVIGSLFFKSDLGFILSLYPNWRNIDVLSHALIRIAMIVRKSMRVHRRKHREFYEDPYHYNKFGQYIIKLPRDPRKRARALAIITKRKAILDSNILSTDTPCPLCLEEHRIMMFRQNEDKLRTPLYFYMYLRNNWSPEYLSEFVHDVQKCGQPRARELQASEVLNF